MHRINLIWTAVSASFWFLPYIIVTCAIALGIGLAQIRPMALDQWLLTFPRLFGASPAGAREMLSTIAGSMISVVGIVFSMTLVALALASSQYSSRVLRTFMRSRITQVSIGVFAGIFVYCLIVLRGVHGQDGQVLVPVAAVSVAALLAIVGVAVLIFFIHHIALSIQAATILASIADETIGAIAILFPCEKEDERAHDDAADDDPTAGLGEPGCRHTILAPRSGYIQSIDEGALMQFGRRHGAVTRIERGVGQFVVANTCILTVSTVPVPDDEVRRELLKAIAISAYRTVEQDPAFGIRQIVDVALKALSPGMNDTTTAVMCLDYLGTILASLAPRAIPSPYRRVDGKLTVIAKGPGFRALVCEAFDQIRRSAGGNVSILLRMIGTIEIIASLTCRRERHQDLAEQLGFLIELSERTVAAPQDRATLRRRAGLVRKGLLS